MTIEDLGIPRRPAPKTTTHKMARLFATCSLLLLAAVLTLVTFPPLVGVVGLVAWRLVRWAQRRNARAEAELAMAQDIVGTGIPMSPEAASLMAQMAGLAQPAGQWPAPTGPRRG